MSTASSECTRRRGSCDRCGRPTCWRCGRCKDRLPTTLHGAGGYFCPSLRCRFIKWLRGGR